MNEQKSWLEWKKRGVFWKVVLESWWLQLGSIPPQAPESCHMGGELLRAEQYGGSLKKSSQNMKKRIRIGFDYIEPAESEVGVWDFRFSYNSRTESFVNIKSAIAGGDGTKMTYLKRKTCSVLRTECAGELILQPLYWSFPTI